MFSIGIMVSGGDCPGLNATVRAAVHHAIKTHGWNVIGIKKGFSGICTLPCQSVNLTLSANDPFLLSRGGIFLGSSNKDAKNHLFQNPQQLKQSFLTGYQHLGLDALIVIGGDGSFSSLLACNDPTINIVAIPKTIDNDIASTELAIGHLTALETIVEAMDRLQTTASSHERIIILEVMGRDCGYLALKAGISGGADAVLIPEVSYKTEDLIHHLKHALEKEKPYALVVVAESVKTQKGQTCQRQFGTAGSRRYGGIAYELASSLKDSFDCEIRAVSLGHIQRGGTPCASDRLLAARFGVKAVDFIAEKKFGVVTILSGNTIKSVPLTQIANNIHYIDHDLIQTAKALGIYVGYA